MTIDSKDLSTGFRRAMLREAALRKPGQPGLAPTKPQDAPEAAKGGKTAKASQKGLTEVRFTIHGNPVGKPRMTQRDKWAKRPCVMKYRAWADKARAAANIPKAWLPSELHFIAFVPIPKSYSRKERETCTGKLHRLRGDVDNYAKSLMDALFPQDGCIAILHGEKRWEDARGPRIEVTVR